MPTDWPDLDQHVWCVTAVYEVDDPASPHPVLLLSNLFLVSSVRCYYCGHRFREEIAKEECHGER
jgi:hypothetical protein